jgi:hypothetical protein
MFWANDQHCFCECKDSVVAPPEGTSALDLVSRTLEWLLDILADAELHDALAGGNATSPTVAFVTGFPVCSPVPDQATVRVQDEGKT